LKKWSKFGFAKTVANYTEFKGIKPKYLTTAEVIGILKRYRIEETAIASFNQKNSSMLCIGV